MLEILRIACTHGINKRVGQCETREAISPSLSLSLSASTVLTRKATVTEEKGELAGRRKKRSKAEGRGFNPKTSVQ